MIIRAVRKEKSYIRIFTAMMIALLTRTMLLCGDLAIRHDIALLDVVLSLGFSRVSP